MIRIKHYRVLCLLGGMFLASCTRPKQFLASVTEHEIDEVRGRSVPINGSLLHVSGPVKNEFSVRASWEIWIGSDNQTYIRWLKNQLSPEYHLMSETTSAATFVKEIEGDSYTVVIRSRSAEANTIIEAQLVAAAD